MRKVGWRRRIDAFVMDLEAGKFDPDVDEPEQEAASPVKETAPNGEAAVNGSENGGMQTTPAEEVKPNGGDDDMQFNGEAEDEAGDNEQSRLDANGKSSANDPKRGNRGEEISVQPEGNQVMIRTIPPDIGRVKLEEASAISDHISDGE